MPHKKRSTIVATVIVLFVTACNGVRVPSTQDTAEEHLKTITIGPSIRRCQGFIEQDCFMEFNHDAGAWEFFYEAIQGFDFEPGFIYTLRVRLEDRGTEIQDVGRYSYHLVKIIDKQTAPLDFSYGW